VIGAKTFETQRNGGSGGKGKKRVIPHDWVITMIGGAFKPQIRVPYSPISVISVKQW